MGRLAAFLLLLLVAGADCLADVVIIVSPSVQERTISRAKLANLFLAYPAYWRDGSSAAPFELTGDAPSTIEFYQQMLKLPTAQIRAYRARQIFSGTGFPPMEAGSVAEMIRRVAMTPGAIGYVPRDHVDSSVRMLTIAP